MKNFKEFLLLLEGQQENLGVNILKKAGLLELLNELKRIDKSSSNKFLPPMAHYLSNGEANLSQIRSIFNSYQLLHEAGKLDNIHYMKKRVYYGGTAVSFKRFSEIVHAAEYQSNSIPKDITEDDFSDMEPIWSSDRYTIFLGDSKRKCIILGKDTPFCISYNDDRNQYNSYRFNQHLTFYFIFDKSPEIDYERIINIGVAYNRFGDNHFIYTDLRNDTQELNGDEMVHKYLERHPEIPTNIFKPVELSSDEKTIKDRFFNKDLSLEDFKNLTNVEKTLYIENNGYINLDKWKILNSKQKNLVINTMYQNLPYEVVTNMSEKYLSKFVEKQENIFKKSYQDEEHYWYSELFVNAKTGKVYPYRVTIIDHPHIVVEDKEMKKGLYNVSEYKMIIEPKYENLELISDRGYVVFGSGSIYKKYGVIDLKTGDLITDGYDVIDDISPGLIMSFEKNGKWGLYDLTKEKEIVPPKYDYITTPSKNGISNVEINNNNALLDVNTKKLSFDFGKSWEQ